MYTSPCALFSQSGVLSNKVFQLGFDYYTDHKNFLSSFSSLLKRLSLEVLKTISEHLLKPSILQQYFERNPYLFFANEWAEAILNCSKQRLLVIFISFWVLLRANNTINGSLGGISFIVTFHIPYSVKWNR